MTSQIGALSGTGWPLLSLVFASVVIMGSPGPSTMSVTAVGAAFGFRRSLNYTWGLITGTATVLFAVALGVVAIILAIPHAAPVLTSISAVYMLYLAFRIATAPPLTSRDQDVAIPAFAGGFLLAIANPKAYLAIAAVFAGSIVSDDRTGDTAIKTVVLVVMIVLIHLCWLLAGASLSRLLRQQATARIINVTLAAVLAGMTLAAFIG